MPTVDVVVECPVHRSFHVEQLAGMFDVPLEKKLREEFSVELPAEDEEWQIGVIVGPSGSGKTTIARKAFGKSLYTGADWPQKKAVVDGFGDLPIKRITHTLTAVGFSSPPSWIKPYAVLSNGEQFRCDLARALLCDRPLVVYDEFTSVVDRTVGKIGAAAVSKAIRKGKIAKRFVAVTCHYDVVEWLQPDWVLDMASGRLARGRLRRPEIQLTIAPVHRSAWVLFRRHHYLSGNISQTARCFCAFWGDQPVAFSAWMNRMTKNRQQGDLREHRTVVLPDYQGLGIGNRLSAFCASIWKGLGGRAFSTTGHPAMIAYRMRSPDWRTIRVGMATRAGATGLYGKALARAGRLDQLQKMTSAGRITGGFEYVGPALSRADAKRFAETKSPRFGGQRSFDTVETIVRRWPGATAGLVARLAGISTSATRAELAELIKAGRVTRSGAGGSGGRQFAFYAAATEALSAQ